MPASIAAAVVIRIGRKRSRQASRIAAIGDMWSSRSAAMAKSTSMMPFFLTMPIKRMMPMMPITERSIMAELQRQQRADAGRRQRGQDRERIDEALVEDAEDDVDDDERRGDQRRFARQRGLEGLRVALEGSDHRRRHADLARGLVHRLDRFSERHAGLQVEAQRDGRELSLVRDRLRRNLVGIAMHQLGARY